MRLRLFHGRAQAGTTRADTAREAAVSRARLEETREQVIIPLHQMSEQNNVAELAARLIRGEKRDGRSPAAG